MGDESSDLSSLSSLSPVASDDEPDVQVQRQPNGILKFFHPLQKEGPKPSPPKDASPPIEAAPKRERHASPPRTTSFSDNPDIAFIVMFRSRFNDAFPKSLQNFGPQELEKDITEEIPGTRVENFLCAILGLLLNRKQDVKPGHYNRALEDAISSHRSQWPRAWEGKNPLSGQTTFNMLVPTQRLTLLRTLILWSLSSSDGVRNVININYKQNRHNDDLNQPLSVQPWGIDSVKRRYYLIEGLDDTAFMVYRESNPAALREREWVSVAGSVPELKALAEKLDRVDGGPKAKKLSIKMMQAVPRFEATEEKRKRREYRLAQKERFKRPEPGFSMYEGRTRGKRIKYTYSDEEEDFMSESTTRRSARNTGTHTPAEPAGPVTTLSGRQVRPPRGMESSSRAASVYSERTQDTEGREMSLGPAGRPRRSAAVHHGTNGWAGQKSGDEEMDDSEPDFGDDEDDNDEHVPEESEEEEDEFEEDEAMDDDLQDVRKSLIIKLHIPKVQVPIRAPPPAEAAAPALDG